MERCYQSDLTTWTKLCQQCILSSNQQERGKKGGGGYAYQTRGHIFQQTFRLHLVCMLIIVRSAREGGKEGEKAGGRGAGSQDRCPVRNREHLFSRLRSPLSVSHLVVFQDALVQERVPKLPLPLVARVAAYESRTIHEEEVAGHILALHEEEVSAESFRRHRVSIEDGRRKAGAYPCHARP